MTADPHTPPHRVDLLALAECIEKASGPDRLLDWEIQCRNGLDGVGAYGPHPAYTASIDAALTLVPDGAGWNLQGSTDIFYAVVFGHYSKACPNAAQALTVAALKALAHPLQQAPMKEDR